MVETDITLGVLRSGVSVDDRISSPHERYITFPPLITFLFLLQGNYVTQKYFHLYPRQQGQKKAIVKSKPLTPHSPHPVGL